MNGTETVINQVDEQGLNQASAMVTSPTALECYELAKRHYDEKRFAEAQLVIEELFTMEPCHSEGLVLNVRIQSVLGNPEGIQTAYFKVLESHPDRSVAYQEFGHFLLLMEEVPTQAENQLLNSLANQPQDGFAHVLLADVYSRTGRVRQAFLHLEIAVRYPLEDDCYHNLVVRLLNRIHEAGTDTSAVRLTFVSNIGNRGRTRFKRAVRAQQKGYRDKLAISRMLRRVWFKNRVAE
ncbi:hypothetical protein SAMN05444487_12112 [Marininema mesophilum]|uniref:Tetratricopeptide repeat-containing protein n=1 Tax=Marininema mesophilum TaxID=1048340 RepID=A0A1H3CA24_9BACL|nr:hypothetical protein [Marininema mesophilum]SDX50936.1 hypothetical protein SAMN05444487_12112 [Marininema mesophilum]